MSYDLHFLSTAPGDLRANLQALKYVTASGSAQFTYKHPNTGVYCTFDMEEGEEHPLSANINSLRPQFFGRELMPVIAQLASSANLRIYDPQRDNLYPPDVSATELEGDWALQNEQGTRAMLPDKRVELPYLHPDRSLYWWQYSFAKDDLQHSLREDIFVPSIFLFAGADGSVRTAATWSAEVRTPLPFMTRYVPLPQVFPVCDYLIMAFGKKGAKLETRYVSYEAAMERLQGIVEDFPGPVSGLKILRPAKQSQAASVCAALPTLETGRMGRIASDGFTDIV